MSYEPEGECELAGHRELGVTRIYCYDAAVAEVVVNEEKFRACVTCLTELAQLLKVSVYT